MKFSISWLSDGQNASAEERATVCALSIEVGKRNVSAYRDLATKEFSSEVVLPAVHLADGIASNWWRIFGSRDVSHRVLPWRTGFALPDLSFEFDGFRFSVFCESLETTNPALSFSESANETLSRTEAENVFLEFIDSVVDKLAKEGVNESEVQSAWARVGQSMQDTDEQAFCEAAGALGVDPYAISDTDASFIEQSGELFGHEPLLEFLAGVRVHAPHSQDDPVKLLDWIRRLRPRYNSRLPELSAIAGLLEVNTRIVDHHIENSEFGAALSPRSSRAFPAH